MKNKIILIFTALLIANISLAQTLSLQDCIEIGLNTHPDYQAGVLNAESAVANLEQAKSERYPTIGVGIYQGTNFGRSIDRSTNTYINELYHTTYGQLSIDQPVFQGHRIKHGIRQNDLLKDAELFNLESTRNQLTIRIIRAYLTVLASEELHQIAINQVETSSSQLDQIGKRVSAGVISRTAYLQIQTQLANDEFAKISASGNEQLARLALFQLMNASDSPTVSFAKIDANVLTKAYGTELSENALTILPEIKAADFEILSYDSRIKAVKALNIPRLNFSANYNTFYASSNPDESFVEQLNSTRNGTIQLGLTIPIFGKWQTNPQIQMAGIQKRVAQNNLESTKLRIRNGVETALQNYYLAAQRYNNAQNQVAINQENVDAVQSQIDAGTIDSIEYIFATTNFERAKSNLVQAKYNFLLEEKILKFYETGEWEL